DHFRRHLHFRNLLDLGFFLALWVRFRVAFGGGLGIRLGVERVFDGQNAGEDRSVGMNVPDLAGVRLLVAVERAAADTFDFALDESEVALLRAKPDEMAVGKADLEVGAARREHFGWRHGLARISPETGRDWTFGQRGLCRCGRAAKRAGENYHRR